MSHMERIRRRYMRIAHDCAMITATDSKHAPYLFNAIVSIRERFPDHPRLYVFDLGMSPLQRKELSGVPWIETKGVDHFVRHWKQNWSWKPYILTKLPQRYVFYFDASNIVLYRPLMLWFNVMEQQGYFLFDNGQRMRQIVPVEYWQLFGCDESSLGDLPTFGAGLMGFDRSGIAGAVIDEVLKRTIEGWNLGRSVQETRPAYDRSVVRHCESFRADQTLFNLAVRKRCGEALILRDELKYCGLGGAADHPRQYLWYSRRKRASLIYFWQPIGSVGFAFFLGRIAMYARIFARDLIISVLRRRISLRRQKVTRIHDSP